MIGLSLQPELAQKLDIILSPRMLQTLKVLNLSYADLVNEITKEAEENVLLEVERQDEYVEFLRYLSSDKKIKKETDFSELPGLENFGNTTKTLEEHLLSQLELEDIEEQEYNLAKAIIENIDDFGFVINYPRLKEKLMEQYSLSRPTVDKALKLVQQFEPEGVAARDLKESLLIQVREYNFDNQDLKEILEIIIKNHLKDMAEKNFQPVAQALNLPVAAIEEVANFIKNNLTANPAASFSSEVKHVIPSFALEPQEQGFKLVNLEQRYGPKINISKQYLKMLEDKNTDQKTKDFIKEKLARAKNLLEDFHKRSETLDKIVRKIVESQKEFLQQGTTWLKPLTQKSLADEFGLHPSTISRSVAAKYIQTPHGVYRLKFLCPRGPKGMTASRIKTMIVEIIKAEDKNNPLSDSQVTKRLQGKGAKINRRTVAYYRQELEIPTADQRQEKNEQEKDQTK